MRKIKLKNIIAALAVLMGGCMGVLRAYADTNVQSMHVSPPYQRIVLIPGETYTDSLVVANANDSTRSLEYELSIGSFSQAKDENSKDDYGTVDHISVSNYNQIMDWITLDKTGGTVKPNEKDIVNYSIKVPENAPAGGQYATIIVKDVTGKNANDNGNVVIDSTFQFASIIYADVAGETKMEGEILDNNMPSFLLSSPLEATSMIRNNGNVHTDAEYTLQVSPLFGGDEICTNEEKPDTALILPETEKYHAQTCELPTVGIFRAKQVVKIFGETSIVERTVVVCPLWLLFLILFIIIALVIWIFMKVRKGHKKSSRSDDE